MEGDGFRDRHERFRYLIARENARRVAADPALLDVARAHLLRFSAPDPRQRDGVALWTRLLDAGPAEVVRHLLERSPEAQYARDTAPSFGALPAPLRSRLAIVSNQPLKVAEVE